MSPTSRPAARDPARSGSSAASRSAQRNNGGDTKPAGRPRHDSPFVFLTTIDHSRQIIARCCERSTEAGVCEGMTLAHARALLPIDPAEADSLVRLEEFTPEHDEEALRSLAEWAARRFSPVVAPDPPSGLLLDITGCDRLFRGERRLMRRIVNSLKRLGFTARIAVAPTVGAAWALSRFALDNGATIARHDEIREVLDPLPVRALRIEPEIELALAEVAIDRVGHLFDLPRSALPSRFGEDLLLRLDQALGWAIEQIDPIRPAPLLRVERLFAGPTTQIEAIELTVQELLDELSAQLVRRESGVRRLELQLDRSDLDEWTTTISLSRPSREAKHLWSLLRSHVESAPLGYGVEGVTLTARRVGLIRHEQAGVAGIDGGAQRIVDADRHWGEFIDTLISRLGADRVQRIEPMERRSPERAFRRRSVVDHVKRMATSGVVPADRPTLLFDRPEPIEVMAQTPDGPIMRLRRRNHHEAHDVVTTVGPERISGEWWVGESRDEETQRRRDEVEEAGEGHSSRDSLRLSPGARDYFRVQDDAGRWLWIYREVETRRWFMHGMWT